jgi:pyrimidine-nucleoside phosphorylase
MDEPLGYKVGHALEIEECAEFLSGKKREQGLGEVTLALAASMVRFASKNKLDLKTSMKYCEDELSTENPYHIFCEMFESQGGNITSFLESRQKTKAGLKSIPVTAPNSGYVSELRADKIGALVVSIGGGRVTKLDAIDTEVGIEFFKKVGDPVKKEEIIATVFYRLDESKKIIQDSINEWLFIQKKKPAKRSLVLEVIQ